jgi:magnesium chelatase family protein
MEQAQLQEYCQLDVESMQHLRQSINNLKLSARAYDRILRLARTIADLENKQNIGLENIFEAVQYRDLDKKLWD